MQVLASLTPSLKRIGEVVIINGGILVNGGINGGMVERYLALDFAELQSLINSRALCSKYELNQERQELVRVFANFNLE